jgi:hypothetical protein
MEHKEFLAITVAQSIPLSEALNNSRGVWLHIEPTGGTPAASVLIEAKLRSDCESFAVLGSESLGAGAVLKFVEAPVAMLKITPTGGAVNVFIASGSK